MNRKGQTTNFSVSDYLREVVKYLGKDVLDYILVNTSKPSKVLIEMYSSEGEIVENDLDESRVILADLLGPVAERSKGDLVVRNLIRHDSEKLTKELMKIVDRL